MQEWRIHPNPAWFVPGFELSDFILISNRWNQVYLCDFKSEISPQIWGRNIIHLAPQSRNKRIVERIDGDDLLSFVSFIIITEVRRKMGSYMEMNRQVWEAVG